ncbi:hypothetical protein [Tessaracoccus sp. G1721]
MTQPLHSRSTHARTLRNILARLLDLATSAAKSIFNDLRRRVRQHDMQMRTSKSYRQEFRRGGTTLISAVKDTKVRTTLLSVLEAYVWLYQQAGASA